MSNETNMQRSPLLVAAAVAISAAGMVTVPATVQAIPMVPLAPECAQYGFPGIVTIQHTNGWTANFNASGDHFNGASASASHTGGGKLSGTAEGSVSGRDVSLVLKWNNGAIGQYWGTVDNDRAKGYTKDLAHPENEAGWSIQQPLHCLKAADAPAAPAGPAAPPVPAPDPAAAGFKTATVTGDVEIYDAPGGNGEVIGELQGGEGQQVQAKCRDDQWCEVQGKGWVFGGPPEGGGEPFLKF
jgi:hypothetical protein